MNDNEYERSADMRLLERQRAALNLTAVPVRSKNYIDFDPFGDSVVEDETEHYVQQGAIIVALLDAQPRRSLIPGAVVTISLSITNDGDVAAHGVHVTLPLPADVVLRPGSCIIDANAMPDLADDLLSGGIDLGDVAPHTVRTIVVKVGIEAGLSDVIVTGHLRAKSGAILGPRSLRLTRGAAAPLSLVPERPFYETDDDESADITDSNEDIVRSQAVSVLQPRELPLAVTPAAEAPAPIGPVPDSAAAVMHSPVASSIKGDVTDRQPESPPPAAAQTSGTIAATAPETLKALVRKAIAQRELEASERATPAAEPQPDTARAARPAIEPLPRPAAPVELTLEQPPNPTPQTPPREPDRQKPAQPTKLVAPRAARPTSLFPETISAPSSGIPDLRIVSNKPGKNRKPSAPAAAAGGAPKRVVPLDTAARKKITSADKPRARANEREATPAPRKDSLPPTPMAPEMPPPSAVSEVPAPRPPAPVAHPSSVTPSPVTKEPSTLVAVPAVQRKLEVVRSPDDRLWVDARGGPILVVSIDRKRLSTLTGLFGGQSLGMIAHYLVLNALAARDPLPMDGSAPAIATFVAHQEKLLSRALIATRLGKTPTPESLSAPLPPFPPPLPAHTERRTVEAAAGSTLLVRGFAASDIAFLTRMLANDSAAPFLRAAQLFVGLCPNDVAVSDPAERKQLGAALAAYATLATAEISRIFLRSRLKTGPVIFKASDPALDDAARTVLAALGRSLG